MKSNTEKNNIIRSGDFKEGEFKIANSAEMFEILSSTLYSDKETAILREIGTNCYDSHIDAGIPDKPFDIDLPTNWNATLRFRDYGKGLSEDEVINIYTVYGESTKRDSNDFVGNLGLGSKSPFALTDSFTVVSYHGGKKTTYSIFKNEQGKPSYAKLADEDTTETGLEILISVPRNNIYVYKDKAINVYKTFKVKPKVSPILTYPEYKIYLEEDNWKVCNGYGMSLAIMGNIAYPIDFALLNNKYRPKFNYVFAVIDFAIGDLNIAASREKLQYTTKTVAALEKELDKIISRASQLFEDQIKTAKSYYEAICLYQKKQNALIDSNLIKWNNKNLSGHYTASLTDSKTHLCICDARLSRYNQFKKESGVIYNLDNKFYFDDLPRGGLSRVREVSRGNNNVYYFALLDGSKLTRKDIAEQIGLNESDLILTSTLPKITIQSTSRGKTEKVLKFIGAVIPSYKSWENATININDVIHYIPINRFSIIIKEKEYTPDYITNIKKLLVDNKLIADVDIYGVRSSFSKKGRKNWIDISQLLEDNFDKIYQSQNIDTLISEVDSYTHNSNFSYDMQYLKSATHKDLEELKKEWEKITKAYNTHAQALTLYKNLAIIMNKEVKSTPRKLSLEDFIKKKPLLSYISKVYWSENEVLKYINA